MIRRFALFIIAAAVACGAWVYAPACLPPGSWEDLAVAAGLRPPESIFPAVWQVLVRPVMVFSPRFGIIALRIAGAASLGVIFLMLFAIFRRLVPGAFRARALASSLRRHCIFYCCALASVAVIMSEPISRMGAIFVPESLETILLLGSIFCLLKFFDGYALRWLIMLAGSTGVMAAESPWGFILIAFVLVRVAAAGKINSNVNLLKENWCRSAVLTRMTFVFLFFFLATTAVVIARLYASDAMTALGLDELGLALHYFSERAASFKSIASGWGLFALLGVVVAPLVVSRSMLVASLDEEHYMPYWTSLGYFGIMMLALSQFFGWSKLWFWNWGAEISSSAIALAMVALGVAFSYSALVLAFDLLVRDYGWINRKFHEAHDSNNVAASGLFDSKRSRGAHRVSALRCAILLMPVAAVAFVAVSHYRPVELEMSGIVAEYVRLVADDCGDLPALVSNGLSDPAIELEMAIRGKRDFKVLSIMAGNSPRERYLRLRGEKPGDDYDLLRDGVANALGEWIPSHSPRATNLAVQVGLELWRQSTNSIVPTAIGTLVRTDHRPIPNGRQSVERARALAVRCRDLGRRRIPGRAGDGELEKAYNGVLWRLARMTEIRAAMASAKGDSRGELAEITLANELMRINPDAPRARRQPEWMPVHRGGGFTSREGLRVALRRANFAMAQPFARKILESDPLDVDANFAAGMAKAVRGEHAAAVDYLKQCLRREPKNAAVLNNIAYAEYLLGHLEAAEKYVTEALKYAPDSAEVENTASLIRNALRQK